MTNNETSDVPKRDRSVKYEKDQEPLTASSRALAPPGADAEWLAGLASMDERQILRERAKSLARKADTADMDRAVLDVVEFELGHERYAVAANLVSGVHTLTELMPVPCTPTFVLGIFRVRGHIVSVIDIREFIDLPARGITDLSEIIVLSSETMELGIIVESILGVRSIALDELQTDLPTLTGVQKDYFGGVTGDGLVVIDAGRILSDERIVVHEGVGG